MSSLDNPPWLSRAWLWTKVNGHLIASALGSVALGLGSTNPWLLTTGSVLAVGGVTWGAVSAPKVQALVDQEKLAHSRALERTDSLRDILHLVLVEIARELELDLSHTRLSIYIHTDNDFVMVQRHSENPTLGAPGRARYPDNEGLISTVWALGGCRLLTNLKRNRDLWNSQCTEKYNIPAATAAQLHMQSRSLLGRRIDSRVNQREKPLGIIMLESSEPNGLTGEHKDSLEDFSGMLLEVLTLVVHRMDEQDGLSAVPELPPRRARPELQDSDR